MLRKGAYATAFFPTSGERIYQTVLERRDHPTAEMVYQQLKPEMPRLSLGTVYRNLQQMAREGRLMELDGPVARFDAVIRPPYALSLPDLRRAAGPGDRAL